MNVLVLYFSKGGNTRRLAEAVAQGAGSVDGTTVTLNTTEEISKEDFLAADGIIAGSPVYFGSMAAPLKAVFDDFVSLRKRMEDKVGAAFATSGDPTGGKETTLLAIIQAMLIYGMVIVGDPLAATGHYGTACVGTPDAKALDNGAKLGRRVANLARRMTGQ
jgi:NAD(P)H dehydrogenase (quinone)